MGELRTWLSLDGVGTAVFPMAFLVVAVWESFLPARPSTIGLSLRWFGNIALMLASWPILALLPFLTALEGGMVASEHGFGLFNIASAPAVVVVPLSFILLDLLGYWEHRLFHAVPMLWRLHALHHSDHDLDVTTAVRHHPLESLVQAGLNAAAAVMFGFPPVAIAFYTATLSVVQVLHHGNIRFPKNLRWMSSIVITPDLHSLHHSVSIKESNSNFSNLFTSWDRMFGTLRMYPAGELRVGLAEFPSVESQRLDRMLLLPFLFGR
jgi:sterol desaturase/sphingolipid hydroxylase (fatty acid hydroxylase superfamily)